MSYVETSFYPFPKEHLGKDIVLGCWLANWVLLESQGSKNREEGQGGQSLEEAESTFH